MNEFPKRLIEVDLPIKRISSHARKEKSIRHGHISTLHIWWARRPLAACRAVICASLWPDPADEYCPKVFQEVARKQMLRWTSHERQNLLSAESRQRFGAARKNPRVFDDPIELRKALLDFIADFSNWDNSTSQEYLDTSRTLTQAAHEALGGAPGTRSLVVDPFAGGGSIPLEALRVGADAFASDLNPLPVLLNKVALEYIPKYGQRLVDEVRKWGQWIKTEVETDLAEFYPKDPDGATPIAYLWARTIKCEGPGCGAEVPLIRSLWLAKKSNRAVALQLLPRPRAKRVDFQIIVKQHNSWIDQADPKSKIHNPGFDGPLKRASATCPCCGYTTPPASVQRQLREKHGGAEQAVMTSVVTTAVGQSGRSFRAPTNRDIAAVSKASAELARLKAAGKAFIPTDPLPLMSGVFNAPIYGHNTWASVFTSRQNLALSTLVQLVLRVSKKLQVEQPDIAQAVVTILSLGVSKIADISNSLVIWKPSMSQAIHLFTRQAIPMLWDFAETALLSDAAGDYATTIGNIARVLDHEIGIYSVGHAEKASATSHPLPSDSVSAFVTDPPYYNAIPYADLSDFFYVWLRYMLKNQFPDLFGDNLAPKADEICEMSGWDPKRYAHKSGSWFESNMAKAMAEGRRLLQPSGIGVVVFAHKSTAGWEAQLQAMIDAGWIITASWPIDTELGNRLRARNSAVLASSVHLVCRPRENPDGSVRTDEVGDWREVLAELPKRIHTWMPRLAEEGVVGADAIFACLGPALEVFSRYSRVEKASGEAVTLKEYLEQVWAAVSKEALNMIFSGADAAGFEEDARLTAMWLWTLATGDHGTEDGEKQTDESVDEDDSVKVNRTKGGFSIEYDAARKIAQGLGAHLEGLDNLVAVQGETAVLLPVAARTKYLFGKDSAGTPRGLPKKKDRQLTLNFEEELKQAEEETDNWRGEFKSRAGKTMLDQVHQSMILFAAGRGEAMKRFLVEDGVGRNGLFWKLAQALSALYPAGTDEKRWVDGVLARKKGLGF
jgi:adenine-specific DNA methylase